MAGLGWFEPNRTGLDNEWTEEKRVAALLLPLSGRVFLGFERNESEFKTFADVFVQLVEECNSASDQEPAMKTLQPAREQWS